MAAKRNIFAEGDWTAQITLIPLDKIAFWRTARGDHCCAQLDTDSPHFVNPLALTGKSSDLTPIFQWLWSYTKIPGA